MLSCTDCPLRAGCQAPCNEVEFQLPSPEAGRDWWMTAPDAQARAQALLFNVGTTRAMLDRRHRLRRRQRQVFDLYYNEGRSHDDIAATLGVQRTTVTESLLRSRRTLLSRRPRRRSSRSPQTAQDVTSAFHDT